ncbi:MAG TPA: TonB-dependent receptor [Gemmatimonadales bacterium]|nr:TonB-dependent receptor [Gemmatimonadales bacterium]
MSARIGPLLAALATVPAVAAAGQDHGVVLGAVRDSVGAPIVGAEVRELRSARTTYTDAAGRYRLTAVRAGAIRLRASRIGYRGPVERTASLAAGDSVQLNFVLAPLALQLTQVTVVDKGPSRIVADAVTSVAVIDEEAIASRAVVRVDEAIDRAPGVQLLNGQINIRGSTGYAQGVNSRVLLLVDGAPANQGDRGGISWDLVPIDDIERVEIVKGAGSAQYGSAAMGGVVHLVTREIPVGWHGHVRATGSGFGDPGHEEWRFRDSPGWRGGLDVSSGYGSAVVRGRLTGGGYHSDGYREQDARDFWHVAGRVDWDASESGRLQVGGSWAVDDYEVPLAWCNAGECDTRGQEYLPFHIADSDRGATTRSQKGYASAAYTARGVRTDWLARASWVRTEFTDHRPTADDHSLADRYGLELRAVSRPGGSRTVTVGVEGALSDVESDIFATHRQGEYAAFGESQQQAGPVRLTLGARIDFLAVDGASLTAVVSPRAGAVTQSRWGIWRASVGRGFRAATLAERFVSTDALGIRIEPNPGLTYETAWSFEIGNTLAIGRDALLDAALFWTEASDLIEPALYFDSAGAHIQFRNVSRARLAGLDAALTAAPFTPRLKGTVAYMLLYARQLAHDTVPEQPLAFRPRHLLTLSADYGAGPATVGADFRYSSRVEHIELEQLVALGAIDGRRVAASVLDLRAAWRRGPWTVRALLANALNYAYNLVPETLAPMRTGTLSLTWAY